MPDAKKRVGAPPNRIAQGGALAALAVSVIGGFEGLRETAYPDPATRGYPFTICYGHTGHVTPGERLSLAQCKVLLAEDLGSAASGIEKCVHAQLPDGRYVAILSLAYNIGVASTCRSSVVSKINAGDIQGGCGALLLYNRAAGIVFPGLTSRRETERKLCLEG
jgi:lysozyme